MTVLRYALGDFDFGANAYLTNDEATLYWVMWFLIVIVSSVIFLNFIIAEASNSYAIVMETLNA